MGEYYYRSFKLGQFYLVSGILVKCIQVTRKGFNFLNVGTNKCIFRSHFYSKDLSFKEVPEDIKIIKSVRVNYPIRFDEIN